MNTLPPTPQAAPPPTPAPRAAPAAAESGEECPNCGAATWGEFCFACGQPKKGLIRRFGSILGDFLDTVFSIDNRLLRTLGPLYFWPGHLTLEYFAGRRVRYVTPFRLFFFLCVLSFLALRVSTADTELVMAEERGLARIASAQGDAEVDAALAAALRGQRDGDAVADDTSAAASPQAEVNVSIGESSTDADELRRAAELRKAWLAEAAKARADGRAPPSDPSPSVGEIRFGDVPWDPESNPVRIGWLPDFANAEINARLGRAQDAMRHARENPRPLIDAFFGAIPPATFLMVPLFALFLKLVYLFKRRLYMEHMLVALHSHAFIFLSLLLLTLVATAGEVWGEGRAWLSGALAGVEAAMAVWVPIYLLLMQKRIYRQGWLVTLLKFGVVASAYMVLFSLGIALAVLLGLFSL